MFLSIVVSLFKRTLTKTNLPTHDYKDENRHVMLMKKKNGLANAQRGMCRNPQPI